MKKEETICQSLEGSTNMVPMFNEEFQESSEIKQTILRMATEGQSKENILTHLCTSSKPLLPNLMLKTPLPYLHLNIESHLPLL